MRWLLLLATLLALAAAPAARAQPEGPTGDGPRPGSQVLGDGLIIPGQRVGPARLTMTIEQIIAAVGGRPRRDEFPREGIVLYEWRAEGLWVSLTMTTRQIRLISAFGTSDRYRTDRGVTLMMRRANAEQIYGKTYREYRYPEDRVTRLHYDDLGLQFGLVFQPSNPMLHDRIFQIGVYRPGVLMPVKRPAE
ncbi:MAG: hypothetical protein QN183_08330 [Armatimonadota bacterium]|nr:hypothetical protein [Armatimonadota bacterium]MDR7536356.1 hypothetical protein [Armatimonadota bacterium]